MVSECATCNPKFTLLETLRSCNLPKRLRANQYPSISTEKSQLIGFLTLGDDELTRYDREIASLQARLARLERKKQDLTDHLSCIRSLLSPVRRLPQEILQEVFSCLAQQQPSFGILIKKDGISIPFLAASHVCAYWQNVVLRTGTLWSKLTFMPNSLPGPGDLSNALEWIVGRAKGTKMHLNFRKDAVKGHVERVLASLLQPSVKWALLSVFLPSLDILPHFDFVGEKTSDLDHIIIKTGFAAHAYPALAWLKDVPLLTTLSLFMPFVDLTHAIVPQLPLEQLVELHIQPEWTSHLRLVLSLCPRITRLGLQSSYCLDSETEQPPVALPKLREISMFQDQSLDAISLYDSLAFLFQTVTVPSLSSLIVATSGDTADWPIEPFKEMHIRSGFALSNLAIISANSPIPNLYHLLQLLPSITSLSLHDLVHSRSPDGQFLVSTDLISSLQVSSSLLRFCEEDEPPRNLPLPCLENLSLMTSNLALSKDTLLQMVRSRSTFTDSVELVSDLRHVNLRLPSQLLEGLSREFKGLQLMGVNVTIGSDLDHWKDWDGTFY